MPQFLTAVPNSQSSRAISSTTHTWDVLDEDVADLLFLNEDLHITCKITWIILRSYVAKY